MNLTGLKQWKERGSSLYATGIGISRASLYQFLRDKRSLMIEVLSAAVMFAEIPAREEGWTRKQIDSKSTRLPGTILSLLKLVRVQPTRSYWANSSCLNSVRLIF